MKLKMEPRVSLMEPPRSTFNLVKLRLMLERLATLSEIRATY